ncbi:acyl-CoA dehydrogenase family protein [Thermodesulfobacteriota bacterium]
MNDFNFSDEQEMFRKTAKEFAENIVQPKIQEMETSGEVSNDVVNALGEAEMMAIFIDETYGGLGLGYTERLIALEEIAFVSVATAMMLQVFGLGIEPILKFGSEEIKQKYLPDLAKGKRLATTAVTEATGGSDPTGIRTTYRKEGNHFIVNGRKCFITNSHIADTINILVKSEDDQKKFCAFVIDRDMQGWKPTHKEHKVGMRGCNTGELVFENLRIPENHLLGNEGDGLKVTMAAIGDVGRGGMVGCALGLQAACLEASLKFSKDRILYGKPISALPTIQNKLAEMKIDLDAGRLLGYRAAAIQDKGLRSSNEFAVAKYFTTEAAQKAAKLAVDIHGGYGCLQEYAVSRYLRDAFVLGPSAGTSDIMKVIISRWVLS